MEMKKEKIKYFMASTVILIVAFEKTRLIGKKYSKQEIVTIVIAVK